MPLEIAANAVNALSILLAARNSVHTWWTGILACLLFMALFFGARLYADCLLQLFFVGTSLVGWSLWSGRQSRPPVPVSRTRPRTLLYSLAVALAVTLAYGYVLKRFTNAYAPFIDTAVMSLSVVAQLLLMRRRYETWWFWIVVNVLSIGLFASRDLWITAGLYCAFLANAIMAAVLWRRYLAR